jgi:hypothetical protein
MIQSKNALSVVQIVRFFHIDEMTNENGTDVPVKRTGLSTFP